MKYALVVAVFLLSTGANASTFKSMEEITVDPRGIIWNYEYSVKSSALAVSTPLLVTEYSCNKLSRGKVIPIDTKVKWKCFNTESEARIAAQKDADDFEQQKIKNGESTTVIEAKRNLLRIIN
jgi:hypothetical protein